MNLEKRVKELERQNLMLMNAFFTVQEATRQGTDATAKVIREDTGEVLKEIQKSVNSFANATGKGFIVTQQNLSVFVEQANFYKELADVLEQIKDFFALNFILPIVPNSPPDWGAEAKAIGIQLQILIDKLNKALP